jgi:hypothetical protein
MIVILKAWEFVQKVGIVIAGAAAGGAIGFLVPLLFDRDVGGAMAAAIYGIVGLIVGTIIGLVAVRRKFD